jgi:hypothetical protein
LNGGGVIDLVAPLDGNLSVGVSRVD